MLGCPCCIYNNWFLSMILRCWGPCWPCMFKGAQHVTHGWPAQIWSLLVILYMAFLHLTTVINFLGHKCCRDSFLGLCTLLHSTCNLMHKSHVCWYVLVNTTKKKKKTSHVMGLWTCWFDWFVVFYQEKESKRCSNLSLGLKQVCSEMWVKIEFLPWGCGIL